MMKQEKISQIISIFKLLSDPTRVKIISLLTKGEEKCVKEIAEVVDISHSAASHQLSKLEDRGIVTSFRMGQTICYQISNSSSVKKIEKIISILN